MEPKKFKKIAPLERLSIRTTTWIGSPASLVTHTIFFVLAFVLVSFGVAFEKVLLMLTTVVSLEAIYLSIFIQMSVNRQAHRLHEVAQDVEEIQEDVEEIQEDVEEIQEDVDEIQEDVEEIQEDDAPIIKTDADRLNTIENTLQTLLTEISELRKK